VDGFLGFSLSVHNRRKSRVGLALENHLAHLLSLLGIRHSRGNVTERRSKPDFLFPGASQYHNPAFDTAKLTMLGVKSTCKDRWRQILSEADRVAVKHLLTLEAGISEHQTDEMRGHNVQLVLPRSLHESYTISQQGWLQDVRSFCELVIARQT
jgi:hypothetical protein